MTVLLTMSVVVLVLIVAVLLVRSRRLPTWMPPHPVLHLTAEGIAVVVLELADPDPDSPATRRIVHDSAARAFSALPDADAVEVRAATGRVIGRVSRRTAARKPVAIPYTA